MKQCTHCGDWFNASEYYKQSSAKDGLDPYHKECRQTKNRDYALNNRQNLNEYYRQYYQKNKERILANRNSRKQV